MYVLPTDDVYWLQPTGVTGINIKVDQCAPGYTGCTLTKNWPSAGYSTNSYNNIVAVGDSAGNGWSYSYDNSDRLIGIRRAGASSDDTTFTYTSTGNKVANITTAGHSWSYSYGSGSTTATLKNSAGGTVRSRTIAFDITTNLLSSDTDKDASGTVLAHTSFTHCGASDTNCPLGMLKTVTAPNGSVSTFNYDSRGNITHTATAPAGGGTAITTSATYPASCTNTLTCNEPTSTTDANGNVTNYSYDSATGLVTQILKPAPSGSGARPKTVFTYTAKQAYYKNAAGSIVASGSPIHLLTSTSTCQTLSSCAGTADEVKTTIDYGPQTAGTGNNLLPVSITKASGNGSLSTTTTYGYDDIGNVVSVNGPLSGTADTTTYRYDDGRKLVGTISADPDGSGALNRRAKRITYNSDGTVQKVEVGTVTGTTDTAWSAFASKQQLTTSYDTHGRKIRDVLTAGGTTYGVTDYSYDSVGRLDCTAVRMNPSAWGTATPACTAQTAGSAGPDRITRNTYDALDRVKAVTSAYGQTYASTESTTYTANGKVASVTDGKGNKTTYIYDGFDRLSKTQYPNPTSAGTSSTTDYEQLHYDPNGNVTERDLRGYAVDNTQKIIYGYDHLNRLVSKNLPGSEADVTYGYDLLDRLKSASQTGNSLSFTYDALGRVLTEHGPEGTLTSTWDPAGRRTKLQWPDGFYVNYDYDVLDEMTKVRENGATSGIGVLASYTYDDLGNRVHASYGNGTASAWTPDAASRLHQLVHNLAGSSYDLTRTFTYNPAQQIASMTSSNTAFAWNAAANVNRSYTVNGRNQYTASGGTSLGYDTRGNLTSSGANGYTYTSENLMKTGPGSTSLTYDPLLQLYQVTKGSATTRFAYDGQEMVAEYNGSNVLQHRYVFGPGTDDPIVQYDGTGTSSRNWLVADERGSIIALTNSSGSVTHVNSYDEYGIPGTANTGRFQYTGQEWMPEIGLYYYKARMYSPSLGRFMQTDPIGYKDGLNWYNYVGADPVNFSDPTGLYYQCTGSGEQCQWIDETEAEVLNRAFVITVWGKRPRPPMDPGDKVAKDIGDYRLQSLLNPGFKPTPTAGPYGSSAPQRQQQTNPGNVLQNRGKMSDEEREKAAEEDYKICRMVNTRECWDSAAERDAARATGKTIPPLRTGTRRNWSSRDVVTGLGIVGIVGGVICVVAEPCGAAVGGALTLGGGAAALAN